MVKMKKIIGAVVLGLALLGSTVSEAASIPTNKVPLHTYAIKRVNCYQTPSYGIRKGWIDPGDYVIISQIRSDGWAYGSYPVGRSRAYRWFRADDLVNNIRFQKQKKYAPWSFTYTYANPQHKKQFDSFSNNEPIIVISDSGQSRQFIAKRKNGGYQLAWAPYWDCWDQPDWSKLLGKTVANVNSDYYKKKFSRGQCTWYAFGRAYEVLGTPLVFKADSGLDAKNWGNMVKGRVVNGQISSRCVGVRPTRGKGHGHVIFIEYVDSDYVYYTDCNSDGNDVYNPGKDAVVKRQPRNSEFIKEYTQFIHL